MASLWVAKTISIREERLHRNSEYMRHMDAELLLTELLSVIHRDGGKCVVEHGLAAATATAIVRVNNQIVALEMYANTQNWARSNVDRDYPSDFWILEGHGYTLAQTALKE